LPADIQRRIDGMAANALRTLIIAYRIFDRELAFAEMARDPPDDELTMIALVGIQGICFYLLVLARLDAPSYSSLGRSCSSRSA
jgi:hypothetical protein